MRRLLPAVLALGAAPSAAHAQEITLASGNDEPVSSAIVNAAVPRACVDALPASAFRPTMVWLAADHPTHSVVARVPARATLAIRLATEAIAWQARALLGAPEGGLPRPDTLLTWRNVGRHLHVVAHRDGRINWAYPWDTPQHSAVVDTVAEPVLTLLGKAIERAWANGDRFAWPDGLGGETLTFLLRPEVPLLDEKGRQLPLPGIVAAPMLEIHEPVRVPVAVKRMGRIEYPERARREGMQAEVHLRFVVDSTGRPVDSTMREIGGQVVPGTESEVLGGFADFARAVRRGLRDSEYVPARIGGCAVAQVVQQPVTFQISAPRGLPPATPTGLRPDM